MTNSFSPKHITYAQADLKQVAQNCLDLMTDQQSSLLQVLCGHESLFLRKHRNWKWQPITIEVIHCAKPFWSESYLTPLKNWEVFCDKVYCQCQIGALQKLLAEEIKEHGWASPCFGVPKKNKTIRLVIDFCWLYRVLKQKEYQLPTIDWIFQNIHGFLFASVIDLNMGYLSFLLTAPTWKLLTIVTTFGFFKCYVLPMGIKPATKIFQSRMVGIFQPMENHRPNPYIDDIFYGKVENFEDHLSILNKIFQRLEEARMQVNLNKSELWSKTQILGFSSHSTTLTNLQAHWCTSQDCCPS